MSTIQAFKAIHSTWHVSTHRLETTLEHIHSMSLLRIAIHIQQSQTTVFESCLGKCEKHLLDLGLENGVSFCNIILCLYCFYISASVWVICRCLHWPSFSATMTPTSKRERSRLSRTDTESNKVQASAFGFQTRLPFYIGPLSLRRRGMRSPYISRIESFNFLTGQS